jgi:hypothetical protein
MILGLDLGVVTGYAFGDGAHSPIIASWDLHDPVRGRRGLFLMQNLFKLIRDVGPEVIYIEEPPNLQGMLERGSTNETFRSLYGYALIVEAVAAKSGIRIEEVDVQKARHHFLGFRPSAGEGKKVVSARCKQLRWRCENLNESDAACVWEFACSIERVQETLKRRANEPVRRR